MSTSTRESGGHASSTLCDIEIHIPISPTLAFFNMVHFFAASLRRNGGAFRGARIVVSVGEDCEPFDIDTAHPELAPYGIAWQWADRALFREFSYFATVLRRWAGPFQSDYVLMADADLLVVGDISSAVDVLKGPRDVCGVVATFPPFMARGDGNTDAVRWPALFQLAGLPPPRMDCRHPGFGHFYDAGSGIEMSPPYYNFGFVLGTRAAMSDIARTFDADYRTARAYMKTDLAGQAALALSISRHNIRYECLPTRFNMWSWPAYGRAFPDEFADVRLLHYLHPEVFTKARDMNGFAALRRWLDGHRTSDEPMTRLMVRHFSDIMPGVEADRRTATPLPVAKPLLPNRRSIAGYLDEIDESRVYSNLGPLCSRLETRLAGHHGLDVDTCATGANATLLLTAAILAMSEGREGCCVMPSWTFCASAHAAIVAGRTPHFVDVDADTWQMTPRHVEAVLAAGVPVAVVMAVAPFGSPVNVAEWDAFTDRTGVPVVIDAASAFATQTAGNTPSVVSLHATKVCGIGEGGYLVSTNSALVAAVRHRLNFGFPGKRVAAMAGFNGKLSEYGAAVGLAALDEWPQTHASWRKVWEQYVNRLDSLPDIKVFGRPNLSTTMIVTLRDRDQAAAELGEANIDTRLWWAKGCHREPAFSQCARSGLTTTETIAESYLGLPIAKDMSASAIERVANGLMAAKADASR